MLIIGGLAVVALIALIALFLILRSGPAKPATPPSKKTADEPQNVPAPRSQPVRPEVPSDSLNGSTPASFVDDWTLVSANPELRARLRGQLRELKYELYYLHQRLRETEQRAALLAGIIARMQELTSYNTEHKLPTNSIPQPRHP